MATRRKFIRNSLGVTGLISLAPTLQAHAEEFNGIRDFRKLKHLDAHGVAGDEDAWEAVAKEFTVDPTIIDLNNASISPQPKIVQRALIESYEASNRGPSYYSWNVSNKNRQTI